MKPKDFRMEWGPIDPPPSNERDVLVFHGDYGFDSPCSIYFYENGRWYHSELVNSLPMAITRWKDIELPTKEINVSDKQ